MDRFFCSMPKVRPWIEHEKRLVLERGYAESMFGRRRRFPFIMNVAHRNKIQRQAVNHKIQSTVSDITLLAYGRVMRALRDADIPHYPDPSIHDSLMAEVDTTRLDDALKIIKYEMMDNLGFSTRVNFVADLEVGDSWGNLHEVK